MTVTENKLYTFSTSRFTRGIVSSEVLVISRGAKVKHIATRLLGGATAIVVAVGMWAAPAAASPNKAAVADTQVTVTQNAAGDISLSRNKAPDNALVAFDIRSSYQYTGVQILKLNPGVTLEQVDVKAAERQQPSTVKAAQAWFIANTTLLGGLKDMDATYGGENHPDAIKFRLVMPAGTYHIVQFKPVGGVKPSNTAKTLTISSAGGITGPYSPQVLRINNVGGTTDRFLLDSVQGPIRAMPTTVRNQAGSGIPAPPRQLHDIHLIQVQPGTTEAEAISWITAGGPSPLVAGGGRLNTGTMSPSRYMDLDMRPRDLEGNVRLGRYVLTSTEWDAVDGRRHFDQGELRMVDFVA